MKKALFILFLFAGSLIPSVAQNVQEVVYLKNGSSIRGIVIEQVPGISLKVQTSDGSIFAYQMSDVEKRTKETVKSNNTFNKKGYKGFIDLGYTIGADHWEVDRIEATTSHGYQLNPHLFVGAGAGVSYYYEHGYWGLPFFAHARTTILNNNISPYIDFKIGYAILDIEGFYMAPSIGYKIKAFNISLGYTMQKVKRDVSISQNGSRSKSEDTFGGICLKIGFEH